MTQTQNDAAPPVIATKTPVTVYAIAGVKDAPYILHFHADGELSIDSEELYEDCDYGMLHGLLVFEGDLFEKTALWDTASEEEREEYQDEHNIRLSRYDGFYSGNWRRMTTTEAVELEILDAPNV